MVSSPTIYVEQRKYCTITISQRVENISLLENLEILEDLNCVQRLLINVINISIVCGFTYKVPSLEQTNIEF